MDNFLLWLIKLTYCCFGLYFQTTLRIMSADTNINSALRKVFGKGSKGSYDKSLKLYFIFNPSNTSVALIQKPVN